MVEITRDGREVVLRMAPEEAERLSFAMRAGFETTSRAEYWIRHAVAQPSARELSDAIYEVASGARGFAKASLDPGVEAEENPRRPRPGRD